MRNQKEKMLVSMTYKDRVMIKEFQQGSDFIGYEAGARMQELKKAGLVVVVGVVGKFKQYGLTDEGKKKALSILSGGSYRQIKQKKRYDRLFSFFK